MTESSTDLDDSDSQEDAVPNSRGGSAIRTEAFDGDGAEWNAFVRDQTSWTHFHLFEWTHVIEDILGHDCPYLAARTEAGALTGVLPLTRVRSPIFGHYLISVPFVNYGGPLGQDEAVQALTRTAADMAAEEGADLLELRSRQELPLDLPASHRKITVLLDLPSDPEILWKDLDSKVRSQVRRPRKEGVEVRFGPDQVAPFHRVFAEHMHALGTPALGLSLFEALAGTFGDDCWFGCAYLDEKPVACGAGFRWGDEFEITWASDLIAYRKIAPNMLLYWAFMERAIEHGLSVFNFGRCTPGSGTHRFKRQWGTRDQQLWWYQRSSGETASTPSPNDDAWSWGPKLWRRLPLKVATALGPRIVRYLP